MQWRFQNRVMTTFSVSAASWRIWTPVLTYAERRRERRRGVFRVLLRCWCVALTFLRFFFLLEIPGWSLPLTASQPRCRCTSRIQVLYASSLRTHGFTIAHSPHTRISTYMHDEWDIQYFISNRSKNRTMSFSLFDMKM